LNVINDILWECQSYSKETGQATNEAVVPISLTKGPVVTIFWFSKWPKYGKKFTEVYLLTSGFFVIHSNFSYPDAWDTATSLTAAGCHGKNLALLKGGSLRNQKLKALAWWSPFV
jgi:hypothetical protein